MTNLCEKCRFTVYVKVGEAWVSAGCSMCEKKQGIKLTDGTVIDCDSFEEEER